MKKNTKYGLILLGLIAISIAVFLKDKLPSQEEKDKLFKVEDIEDIDKIYLENRANETMLLEKKEGIWILNGKYIARERYMELLLEAVQAMEIKTPVANASIDRVVNELMKSSVRVEVYTGDNEPERIFHVGGPNAAGDASNMVLQLDEKTTSLPYEIYLPGFKGYLSSRFVIDEEAWRSRTLFSYSPEEIANITLQYPASPSLSYTLYNENSQFSIETIEQSFSIEETNQVAATNYILLYEMIGVDGYNLQTPDTLVQLSLQKLYASLSVTDKEGKTKGIEIYTMPLFGEGNIVYDADGNLLEDPDRFYAKKEGEDEVFAIQKYVFNPILREAKDFIVVH